MEKKGDAKKLKVKSYYKKKNVGYRAKRAKEKYEKKKVERPDIKEQECMKCKEVLPIYNFKFRNRTAHYAGKCNKCKANKIPDNVEELPQKERKKVDTLFKVHCSLKSRLNRALVREIEKTSKLFGAPIGVMIKWAKFNIELDEVSGMTYENKGKYWLLYNVIPCEHFNLMDKKQQRKAFHWTNLKPMRTKGHKDVVNLKMCLEQELRLKVFGIKYGVKFGNSPLKSRFSGWGALTTAVNKKLLVQQDV